MRPSAKAAAAIVSALFVCGSAAAPLAAAPAAAEGAAHAALLSNGGGPAAKYLCSFNINTDAFTGAYATASAIGWEGNEAGVTTCLGGSFVVQGDLNKQFGFGIYTGTPTTWTDADGYLPAQVTNFGYSGAKVTITEFADKVVIGGDPFVAVYSRVAVRNPTSRSIAANPDPTAGMVEMDNVPDTVPPHATAKHDYVLAVDRFGNSYPWPSAQVLADSGTFNQHFAHMASFWNGQLAGIAQVNVPNASLNDAYKSGFIYTQIARSANNLNTGVNGYNMEFDHDVVGILTNLFTQGEFTDAHALLLSARDVMGPQGQYNDGIWTYPLPWAVYLMKTGDLTFVKENFDAEGPAGTTEPSIEDAAHQIAADRTGPSGIMESTNDLDSVGYWTSDDNEALLGLVAYQYLATRIGNTGEAEWAAQEYASLLAATNRTLDATISRYHLNYLPCSMLKPNTENRCVHPKDANWASPLSLWAWNASLFGAPEDGPGISMIDATYAYGFKRLNGLLPPDTFGGFPDDYYSSGYNAGYGSTGLASKDYRDQGILSYEFMIANSQSGPYSFWESSTAPSPSPWTGKHPGAGQGASPHGGESLGQQGALGLAGRTRVRRHPHRRPRRTARVARRASSSQRGELPDARRQTNQPRDHFERQHDHVGAHGPACCRAGALRAPLIRQEHRIINIGRCRPVDRNRDTRARHQEGHRHAPHLPLKDCWSRCDVTRDKSRLTSSKTERALVFLIDCRIANCSGEFVSADRSARWSPREADETAQVGSPHVVYAI